MPGVDMASLGAWMDAYGRAWISNEPAEVAALFSEGAAYYTGPFKEPWRGRDRIVTEWIADPWGQTDIRFHHQPLAVTGDRGVAHWRVSFLPGDAPTRVELDGVLVLRFDPEGRCTEHREWYARREVPGEGGA